MSLHNSPKLSAEQLAVITDLETQDRVVPAISSPCSTSDQGRTSDQHVGKLDTLAEDGSLSERTQQKRRIKAQRNLANEFVSALGARIAALETTLASGTAAEKEAARARRKQLREVQKVAGDPALAVEERLRALQGALLQQAADAVKGDRAVLELRAQLEATTKERDRARAELQSSNALRRKLEELCRTLQRENKEAIESSSRRAEDDRALQQAMQTKLNSTLEDLQSKIKAQETTLLTDNASLREALGKHAQHAALEAERNAQALQMKDLELQLAQTQLKQKELLQQEVEARCAAEVQVTLAKTATERGALLEANSNLQEQLNMYSSKFKGFEKTLQDSNKMYNSWKTQLEAQQKQAKLLLQERNAAHSERLRVEKAAAEEQRKLKAQVDALQKLCRALQAKLKTEPAGTDAATVAGQSADGAAESGGQRSDQGAAEHATTEAVMPAAGIDAQAAVPGSDSADNAQVAGAAAEEPLSTIPEPAAAAGDSLSSDTGDAATAEAPAAAGVEANEQREACEAVLELASIVQQAASDTSKGSAVATAGDQAGPPAAVTYSEHSSKALAAEVVLP